MRKLLGCLLILSVIMCSTNAAVVPDKFLSHRLLSPTECFCFHQYNIDVLEVGSNTTRPDLILIEWEVARPSRGVFGISGFIDIKEDIETDTTKIEVKIFYSPNGISYQLSPFRIPEQTLTHAINRPYKDYLMEAMVGCCKNAPNIEGVFVTPLTRRLVKCDSCLFPSKNFPSSMRTGFYRMVVRVHKGESAEAFSMVLIKVEWE